MANSKSSKKDYSTMNIKNYITRSGRKSSQFDVSFTQKCNENNKNTPASKTPRSAITKNLSVSIIPLDSISKKDSQNKKTPTQNKNAQDLSHNSSNNEQENVCENETHKKPALRCRKRIDYAEMFRGSSIINEKLPIVLVKKLPDYEEKENLTKTVPIVKLHRLPDSKITNANGTESVVKPHRLPNPDNASPITKRHKVYSAIHNFEENIRPSQIYEFKFNPIDESALKKRFKKEAKILKKKIRDKSHKKHEVIAGKNKENVMKDTQRHISKQMKKTLNILTEITEEQQQNNISKNQIIEKSIQEKVENVNKSPEMTRKNNLSVDNENVLLNNTPIDDNSADKNSFSGNCNSFGSSFKAPESTPIQVKNKNTHKSTEVLKENENLSKITPIHKPNEQSIIEKSFDKIRMSNTFESSFKAPQSTPIQVTNKNSNKSTENENLSKITSIQKPSEQSIIRKSFDKMRMSNTFGSSFKAPQSTPIHSKSINFNLEQNQSNLEISQIDDITKIFDDFDDISIQSCPSIEMANQSIPWRAEIPLILKQKFFHSKNTSLPSYNQDIIIKPTDNMNLSHTNNLKCINSEKKTRQTSMLSFVQNSNLIQHKQDLNEKQKDSSTSLKDLTNSFESSLSDISIEGNSNFVAIDKNKNKRINFQKAVTSSPSVKKNVLRENNSSPRVQNTLANTNKENVKSPVKKVLHENNSSSNIQDTFTNKDVYDESNKENFYLGNNVNITNNCAIELEKDNSSFDFFGFNSFEQTEARKSKKPMRYPSVFKPVIPLQVKNVPETLPVHEESIDFPNEEIENNEMNLDANFELFDEPRFSNYVRRSYAPATKRKRKQVHYALFSGSEDELDENCTKKRKKKKPKKENEEFKKWAKTFNSMCQEVEKEELVIE